ncbi:MAG TPA: response regulator [Candidatus Sulfotelmatobacter sp.]|nr:response regulator [Candidatus Sulfotelmatobacter sp.]
MALILVVDDDTDVRELVAAVLAEAGHSVLTAQDGSEAIELIDRTPAIDLMFTDLVMPRMDGIELGAMARARRPEIKILYATGYMDFAKSKTGGIDVHGPILGKPYRPAQLMDEITRLLA